MSASGITSGGRPSASAAGRRKAATKSSAPDALSMFTARISPTRDGRISKHETAPSLAPLTKTSNTGTFLRKPKTRIKKIVAGTTTLPISAKPVFPPFQQFCGQNPEPQRHDGSEPYGRHNIEGLGRTVLRPQCSHKGRYQLDRRRVDDHKHHHIIVGFCRPFIDAAHLFHGGNPQRRRRVSQPQQIGCYVHADRLHGGAVFRVFGEQQSHHGVKHPAKQLCQPPGVCNFHQTRPYAHHAQQNDHQLNRTRRTGKHRIRQLRQPPGQQSADTTEQDHSGPNVIHHISSPVHTYVKALHSIPKAFLSKEQRKNENFKFICTNTYCKIKELFTVC